MANTLAYMMEEPQRGDVIVFKGDDKQLLKRIIGLPNDTISFADGNIRNVCIVNFLQKSESRNVRKQRFRYGMSSLHG